MTVGPLAASLVTQVWIGREFGRLGLGEYHAASLFVTVLTAILFFGFPTAVAQRVAALDEARDPRGRISADTALTLTLLLGSGVAVLGLVSWGPFARAFALRAEFPLVLVPSALLAAAIAGVAANTLLAKLKVRRTTLVILAQPIGVAVVIVGSYLGLPVSGVELALLGFVAAGLVGLFLWITEGARPRLDPAEAPRLLRGSLPATLWTYPSLVTGWVDRAIIGVILGPAALGAFVAASTLVEGIQRLTRGLATLGVPAYARLAGDIIGASRVLDSHLRLISATFILAGSAFIAAGSGMLSLLFGEGFAIATTTLRLLSIALLPLGVAIALASHGVGSNTSRNTGRILLLLLPTHLIVGSVATAIFHIAGTALANLVVWGIGSVLYVAEARRRGAPLRSRTLLHAAGIGIPLFMGAWIVGLSGLPWPLRGAIVLLPAFALVGAVLIGEPERRLIRRLLPAARLRPR